MSVASWQRKDIEMVKEKWFPEVGEKLYLQSKCGMYYVDLCKYPYTVIAVSKSVVTIQEAKCLFNGPQYYDTLPDNIVEDKHGRIKELHWAPKKGVWQENGYGNPHYAHFGEYEYFPYLD